MSHEVLITRGQSIFIYFFCKSTELEASEGQCWLADWDGEASSSVDLQKNKNALSSGYQDLMGHLILTTRP